MIERTMELPAAAAPDDNRGAPENGVGCADCGLREMCLPRGLDAGGRDRLDQRIRRRRPLRRGEMLYVDGRPAHSLYAIRSGSVKTYVVSPRGEELVQGFCLPGEVLGFESLACERHDHFAEALEETLYCEIPARALEDLLLCTPPLQRQLLRIINGRLAENRRRCFVQNRREACIRVAAFLLELSRRRLQRNLSPTDFRLSMDRRDIASYLGLTLETVSRSFSHLRRQGALRTRGKHLSLVEPQALAEASGAPWPNPSGIPGPAGMDPAAPDVRA